MYQNHDYYLNKSVPLSGKLSGLQGLKLVLKVALKKFRDFHLEHFVMKNSTHPLLPEISARTTKAVQGLKLTFPFTRQLATRGKFLVANLNFLVTNLAASMVMSEEITSALMEVTTFGVRVIGSSKKIARSKEKSFYWTYYDFLLYSEHFNHIQL